MIYILIGAFLLGYAIWDIMMHLNRKITIVFDTNNIELANFIMAALPKYIGRLENLACVERCYNISVISFTTKFWNRKKAKRLLSNIKDIDYIIE